MQSKMASSNSSNPFWINYDGSLFPADTPLLTAASRAFKYADGLFETMLLQDSRIRFGPWHFERLFAGLQTLHFSPGPDFTPELLESQIQTVWEKNGAPPLSRVRLAVFRG